MEKKYFIFISIAIIFVAFLLYAVVIFSTDKSSDNGYSPEEWCLKNSENYLVCKYMQDSSSDACLKIVDSLEESSVLVGGDFGEKCKVDLFLKDLIRGKNISKCASLKESFPGGDRVEGRSALCYYILSSNEEECANSPISLSEDSKEVCNIIFNHRDDYENYINQNFVEKSVYNINYLSLIYSARKDSFLCDEIEDSYSKIRCYGFSGSENNCERVLEECLVDNAVLK